MTTKLAWKNIWRNKTRSILFISAALLGLALAIFTINLMKGIAAQRLNDAISIQTGHLQIQHQDYNLSRALEHYIQDVEAIQGQIQDLPHISAISKRMVVEAVLSTPENTSIAQISGVLPEEESFFSALDDYVLEGDFLFSDLPNPILVSQKTADRLNVKLKSKVILTLKGAGGEIVGGAFRVAGIFKTPNAAYDENNALVKYQDLANLSGIHLPHQLSILVKERNEIEALLQAINNLLPETYTVYSWQELLPQLYAFNGFTEAVSFLFTIIILLGLGFALLNTMNMIVQERTRELGMLRAIGLGKWAVFAMLVKEAGILMLIGSGFGICLGIAIVSITSQSGVPLGVGFAALGIRDTIYPTIVWSMILMVCVLTIVLTFIIAVFPAYRALSIQSHQALRDL